MQHCCCSSVVEHFLGKEEVTSSILVNSSQSKDYVSRNPFFISAERPDREQAERTAAVRRLRRCPMRKMQAGEGRWLPRRQMRRCTLGWAGCRDAKCGDARWGPPAAETPHSMRKSPEERPLQADEKRQNKQSEARLPPNQPILRPKWTIQADRLP